MTGFEPATGKLDVRETAKRLPAEVEVSLPADDLPDDDPSEEDSEGTA